LSAEAIFYASWIGGRERRGMGREGREKGGGREGEVGGEWENCAPLPPDTGYATGAKSGPRKK